MSMKPGRMGKQEWIKRGRKELPDIGPATPHVRRSSEEIHALMEAARLKHNAQIRAWVRDNSWRHKEIRQRAALVAKAKRELIKGKFKRG